VNEFFQKALGHFYIQVTRLWVRDVAILLAITVIAYLPGLFTVRVLGRYRNSPRIAESRRLKVSLEALSASVWPLWAILLYSLFGIGLQITKTFWHPFRLLPILFFFLLYRLLTCLTKELLPPGPRRRRIRKITIPAISVLVILQQLGLLKGMVAWMTHPFFKFGTTDISAFSILLALGVVAAFIFLARVFSGVLESRLLPGLGVDPSTSTTLGTLSRYCLVVIGVFVGLNSLGFDLSTLKILLGALGVGVGFGLQNVVNNFASGLIILFERKVKKGDIVSIAGMEARVVTIGLRSSVVRSRAGHDIIIPNSDLVGSKVTNFSYQDSLIRVDIPVGVSYGSDPNQVRDILLDATRDESRVVDQPPPTVLFKQYGESSIDFELRVWTDDPWMIPSVRSSLYFAIWYKLKQAGIEIPFPQMDLHVRSGEVHVRMNPPKYPESGAKDEVR